jgi:hypothetical protein
MNHRNIDFQRFSLAVHNPNSNPAYLHLDRTIDHMHIIHSTSTILSLGVMLIVSFRIRYAFIDDRDEQGIHVSRSIGSVALDMLSFRLHVSKPVARSDMRLLSAIPRQPLYIPHFCTLLQSLSIARSDSVIDTIANDPSM